MLHTKFQGHQSSGSGEDFLTFFTMYGHGGHVGYVIQLICINFHSHSPLSFHLNFCSIRPTFFEKKKKTSFNIEIGETLTFDTHSIHKLIQLNASSNFET